MFNSVPAAEWRTYVPFVVNHIDTHPRRMAFLNSMLMAVPERIQLVGRFVYEGTSEVNWKRVRASLPELVPPHLNGHAHQY